MNPKENQKSAIVKPNQQMIKRLADKESEERDEMTKKYVTQDEKETAAYELGYSDGYRDGSLDSWGKGFDEGLKQAAKEQKEKEES
jgi:hypothetical protein